MHSNSRNNTIEWAFLAAMVVICGVLTVLQYRWTGELARGEIARLRENLQDQAQLLGQDFDSELANAAAQLLPGDAEIDAQGRETAFAEHLRKWQATNPRRLFSRMVVALPTGNGYALQLLDQKTATLAPMSWPKPWDDLRDHLGSHNGGSPQSNNRPDPGPARPGEPNDHRDRPPPPNRVGGGSPAYTDRNGLLLQFPIGGEHSGGGGAASHGWMILELDSSYLSNEWMPQLIRDRLGSDRDEFENIVVTAPNSNHAPFFSLRAVRPAKGPDFTLEFNHLGHSATTRGFSPKAAWALEIWRKPGAFEAMVDASRRRNLAVAACLNLLIVVVGGLLVRHTRRLRKLAEAQMNFVANVSHELRTPLTVIRGAAHNLERGVVQDPAKIGQYLRLIQNHAEQLGGMVEQVLVYAGAGQKPALAPRQEVAIKDVLSAAIDDAGQETGVVPCEVEFTVPPALPVIQGDPLALRRAFQNLIANAVKHGGEGGWVGVTVRAVNGDEPPAVEVRVADRGSGIPEEEQAAIFEPFVRGAAAQNRQVRGTGLGLSLVRQIVEAHGGAVSVSSRPGHGAIFTVRLPAL